MIKEAEETVIPKLKTLFNACFETQEIPETWNESIIILLHKKGDPRLLPNCRPIWLLSHIYKLFTRIIIPLPCKGESNRVTQNRITPKLFTLALEGIIKKLDWLEEGGIIDGERLTHLKYADDIVLVANNAKHLDKMITHLNQKSKKIYLKINLNKTKTTCPVDPNIIIDNNKIEHVKDYTYLG
uniref:Reverse transcriptase domain-containing protein n=1 Tax=Dendroctonus ponderosae TaxID=77166 RepID=A0AAR5P7D9_DENPD